MRVYFAGKITKNDWRTTLAPQVNDQGYASYGEAWRATQQQRMKDGNVYTGPFFISDDHGCGHGENRHGAGLDSPCICGTGDPPTASEVRAKALAGIRLCDLFVCVIGEDFSSAFGTQNELGYAQALGKTILVILHPCMQYSKAIWFPLAGVDSRRIVIDNDPIRAFHHFIQARSNNEVR